MIDELDRRLGMNRPITRRDLLHGFGAITAGIVLPSSARKHKAPSLPKTESSSGFYPPALTGMRGNHLGSYEVMHKLTRGDKTSWTSPKRDKDHYDLVIVGAGISGLSAAYFFQKERPDARILLLDNHDDFGGHAKRNEFEVDGRKLISYGGAQTMAAPSRYPRVVKRLLRELGVDMGAFNKAYDQTFYRRHKLSGGIHFNKELWGNDATIPFDVANFRDWMPMFDSRLEVQDAVPKMPLSQAARLEILRLFTTTEDQIPHLSKAEKWDYLYTISYRDFLIRLCGIT